MNTTAAGFVIAIDQGTTSSRSIVFDHQYAIHSQAQVELEQFFPHSGWVEQDPERYGRRPWIRLANRCTKEI